MFFIIVNLWGAGAFSRDFTINLSPQCRAFSRALKTEKLKAPLFPSYRAGTTDEWCITFEQIPSNFSGVVALYKFGHFKLL